MAQKRLMKPLGTNLLGLGLLVVVIASVLVLIGMWPLVSEDSSQAGEWRLFGLGPWAMSRETALLVLVILVSALGSFVHAATSFATYVGNRRLYSSWFWWYVLRTAIGAALALIVYFAIRGGLVTGNATSDDLNPYGIAAIAGMTGLFSKQATDKLKEVFSTLFATSAGDRERSDKATFPEPIVMSISPAEVQAGSGDAEIVLTGNDFVAASRAHGIREGEEGTGTVELATTYDTPTSMRVRVPAALLENPGTVLLSVANPEPGGGESDHHKLVVSPASGSPQSIRSAEPGAGDAEAARQRGRRWRRRRRPA
ncbi:hypothetical protein AB0E63_46350 [Kribbella sp. NPDC026596]|uniref:hypothetical protein n=1 Tax=Kribbella sp. NPDC026596 TaxID=3155122 RepID=UPI0033D55874